MRTETRRERYNNKLKNCKKFPLEIACINFMHEGNAGYVVRSAACFGAEKVNIIGACPAEKDLRRLSGTTCDYIDIQKFSNPSEFLKYCRENNIKIVAAELTERSQDINKFKFPKGRVCIVVGHEELGVPQDIIQHSDVVQIPMPGVGFCLNTAVTASIMMHEYAKQNNI